MKTVDEYLSAWEKSSLIFDVNNDKTVNFQDKTLEEDLSNFENSSFVFDVIKQKTSDSLKKTAKEGLSACDNKRSSGIDQPKFDMIQPKTALLLMTN